jgi:hypothetical protein
MQVSNFMSKVRSSTVDFSHKNSASNTDDKAAGSLGGLLKSYTVKTSSSADRIANLMERKQSITDMKTAYHERALEKGEDKDIIKAKLAEYDGMITKVDQEITKIRQEDQKKASGKQDADSAKAGSSQKSEDKSDGADRMNGRAVSTNQSLIKGLSSAQNTQDHIEAVQFARNVLQTQALSYKPSFAWKGEPEKYAELTAKADGLQGDIGEMNQDLLKNASQITESSSQPAEEKTAQEKAVENYKRTADGYTEEDGTNTADLDVLA